MNDTFVFVNQIFTSSGTETYIFRMSKWLKEHKYDVILLLPENCSQIDDNLLKNTESLGVKVDFCIPSLSNGMGIPDLNYKLSLDKSVKITLITFTVETLFIAESIMYANPEYDFTNITYMVHPNSYIYKSKNSNFIRRGIFNPMYSGISSRLVDNRILYFLSENHKNIFIKSTFHKEIKDRILRLGTYINGLNVDKTRNHYKQRKIVTVSRFDFPFKDYLKGLIDSLEKLDKNVSLNIIGWGQDEEELMSYIEKKRDNIRNRINVIKGVTYQNLQKYLDDAFVYIGEGTSVLDALNNSLLSIVVNEYDRSAKTNGYFYDNYNVTTTECNLYQIEEFLKIVFSMSEEEYITQVKKDYNRFVDIYNINNVMKEMIAIKNNNTHAISKKEIKFFTFMEKTIDRIRRIIRN